MTLKSLVDILFFISKILKEDAKNANHKVAESPLIQ